STRARLSDGEELSDRPVGNVRGSASILLKRQPNCGGSAMRAVVFEEFGWPEVLGVQKVPEPQAGPGQVRIKVRAAGVNPIDFKVRRGWTKGFIDPVLPAVPGLEVAGVVDQVGEGAEFAVGDEVVGW